MPETASDAPLEAWYLPDFEPPPRSEDGALWHEDVTAAGTAFRAPRLGEAEARAVAATVRATALQAREERSLDDVVRAVARAARRLADPEDDWGAAALALLGRELGWPPALAGETLAGMAAGWTEDALHGLLRAEFGDPGVLDEFRPDPQRPDRLRRASGPEILFQVHAGNVPGVAVSGVIRALLVRSGVLCKLPSDEPGLVPLFAKSLADQDALLGRAIAATWWPGEERPPASATWGKASSKVVVYGGDAAVRALRCDVPPSTDVVVYGPRAGAAVVLADAPDDDDLFERLARDICAYEQRGCVSPRWIFVIGHEPEPFVNRVARAVAAATARIPPPRLSTSEAIAIRNARTAAEFGRARRSPAAGAGTAVEAFVGSDDLSWTVILHPTALTSEPAPQWLAAEPLPRVARVVPAESVEAVLEMLRPLAGRLQAIGYLGQAELRNLAEGAARLGVSRLSPVGTMAWPPADWRHEGRHALLPLVSWADWETD